MGAILGVDILATLFCLFGWLSDGLASNPQNPVDHFPQRSWTDIVTVVTIWLYSIGVTIVIAIVYYLLNSIPRLNDLGRKVRSKKDADIENIIAAISKLAVDHEKDDTGRDRFVVTTKAAEEEEDD